MTCVSKQFLKWTKGVEVLQKNVAEAANLPILERLMCQPTKAAKTSTKGVINQGVLAERKLRPAPGLQDTNL